MALHPVLDGARQAVTRFGRGLEAGVERWMAAKSLADTTEIISPETFPWVATLEANWAAIRRELDAVMAERAALPAMREVSPTQALIVKDAAWKLFALHTYGRASAENRRRCPETARLLDAIPDLEVAFFSVLEPGAHLKAHRGAYKGLIRTHLGLIVPPDRKGLRMQVGRETIHWEEGRCVVFDDTYRHEVWNETDGVRVVLLIDTPRPFPPLLAAANKAVLRLLRLTPFVTGAVARLKAWERSHYAAKPEPAR